MRSGLIRRLAIALLSMTLVVGLAVHSVHAIDMSQHAMATTGSDMPMSGKCSGCAGNEKATAAACSAFCGSSLALTSVAVAFDLISIVIDGPSTALAAIGHAFPPDPYPPRPILS